MFRMPRTKLKRSSRPRRKLSPRNMANNETRESSQEDLISLYISNFDRDVKTSLLNTRNKFDIIIEHIDRAAYDELLLLSETYIKKTMRELRTDKSLTTSSMKSMMYETTSFLKHLNFTSNTTTSTNKVKKPTDDEGYLTAGESGNMNGDHDGPLKRSSSASRKSRQPARTVRVTRTSRSLSRSKLPPPKKNVTIQAPEKKTPDRAMRPPIAFGMVTPKMKPNMPVSVFRRPKQGEMAISMQGSPLLVSGVVTESCANVNIPLQDGKILSLQPSRGLRMSEIPYLDEETRQQLTTLRDNLNKVVKIAFDD